MTRRRSRSSHLIVAGLTATIALLSASPGAADPVAEARVPAPLTQEGTIGWNALLGCWEPVEAGTPVTREKAAASTNLLCIVPTGTEGIVELTSITAGAVTSRVRLDTSGSEHQLDLDGCSGSESARWSADQMRVYLTSELTCPGEIVRHSSGLLTLVPDNQLLHLESITVGDATATRVLRYHAIEEVREIRSLPAEVSAALAEGQSLAARTARIGATRPLTTAAVIDAAKHLDQSAIQSWLIEMDQGFRLDARELLALDKAGVEPDIIDLMVALTYPEIFTIDRATTTDRLTIAEVPAATATSPSPRQSGWGIYHYPDLYLYRPYLGHRAGFYSPFYGYGYGYGYDYGWYQGRSPVIIIREPQRDRDETTRRGGRVIRGKGYSRGRSTDSDREGARARPAVRSADTRRDRGTSGTIGTKRSSERRPVRTAKPRDRGKGQN